MNAAPVAMSGLAVYMATLNGGFLNWRSVHE